jgi:hypothetical protein
MATLINLGQEGINADYIACWNDDPHQGELSVQMAVPCRGGTQGGTYHLHRTYREEKRTLLLEYLERWLPK